MIRALTLDLDGTLRDEVSTADALRATANRLANLSGLSSERLLETNASEWGLLWPEVEDDWTLGAMTGEAVTLEAWRRTLEACGVTDGGLVRRATQIHLGEILQRQRLFDDAARFLDHVDGVLPLALVTNGASDTQRAVLRRLDLERRFRTIVISGEVGAAKPDAAVFHRAVEHLDADRSETCHVGDSLVTDVAGAKAAGLKTAWLNRRAVTPPDGSPLPDLVVRTFEELRTLLRI